MGQPSSACYPQPTRNAPCARVTAVGERMWWTAGTTVEEQGTLASRTRKRREAGCGWPVWTAKTVKRPPQQPAQPQYANYWALLTRTRHILPHPAQPQHTNHWAPRMRKRHQQEHRPQWPTESSNPTQHAKGRTGGCPGPCKETTTRRNVTQGGHPVVANRHRGVGTVGRGMQFEVCRPFSRSFFAKTAAKWVQGAKGTGKSFPSTLPPLV